ncbi:MAG: Chitinase, partial [Acidobacteria bacterium]|nr:Chitinase [Acidobacteriota bacterium]
MNIRKIGFGMLAALVVGLLTVSFLFPFRGGAANSAAQAQGNDNESQTSNPEHAGPPNFDAFAASAERDGAKQQKSQSAAQRGANGRLNQFEPRIGVPTFLWASDLGAVRKSDADGAAFKNDIEGAAREHLSKNASAYRLESGDVLSAKLASIHDTGKGAIIVKFKQSLGNVEVFRDEINVIMNRSLQLLAISGYITGDHTSSSVVSSDFQLRAEDVVAKAVQDLTGTAFDPSVLRRLAADPRQSKSKGGKIQNPYIKFTADNSALQQIAFGDEPARAKKVLFHMPDSYIPAYYVEVSVQVPSDRTGILSLSGEAQLEELAYSYVISAQDGQVLFRKNMIAESEYTYRVWADPVTKFPYDTPAGNDPHPKLIAQPDGAQSPFVAMSDVTLQNYPFSKNDPWLAPGATETVGNNVDAFANLFNPDGYGPIAAPANPATGDFRAQITGADQFLHTHIPDASPTTAEARQASVQQLFYNINFLHDWFYDSGFDEASGNAQNSNFGRGGLENDSMKGQVQDVAGRNNANMLTPADGARPRMRMYVFDSNALKYLDVQAPAAAAGQRTVGTAAFGPQSFDITNEIVYAAPINGCTALTNAAQVAGKFVMVDMTGGSGTCSIGTKLNNGMSAGAAGFILVYQSSSPNSAVNVTGSLPSFTIPFLSISWNGAATIKTEIAAANTVTARMRRDAGTERDGTLDNQIVFHEWGHYISNRLIANSAGLNTNHSGGMGEGWGDFTAMMLTVRQEDTLTPTNTNWNGAYALATYATSGSGNNGYYFGIRRYPYSTDMAINPLTFKHIEDGVALPNDVPSRAGGLNSQVHNTGEVWATMLWEGYAALLRDTQGSSPRLTFDQAQERMKNYLVAGLKMTPPSPTFLEARDGVLAAAFANDPVDGELFAQAFARRGAGTLAVAPDRYSSNNAGVVESFTTGSNLAITGISVDDGIASCDNDNILDNAERGRLNVTIKNPGGATLDNAVATVSSSNPKVTFPNGAVINFPPVGILQSATASIEIAANGLGHMEAAGFTVSVESPETATSGPVTRHLVEFLNFNESPASSATENVESLNPPWSITKDASLDWGNTGKWTRAEDTGTDGHHWHGPSASMASDHYLTSPVLQTGAGNLTISFKHRFDFEFDGGGNYDGGVIEVSTNGGATWADLNAT